MPIFGEDFKCRLEWKKWGNKDRGFTGWWSDWLAEAKQTEDNRVEMKAVDLMLVAATSSSSPLHFMWVVRLTAKANTHTMYNMISIKCSSQQTKKLPHSSSAFPSCQVQGSHVRCSSSYTRVIFVVFVFALKKLRRGCVCCKLVKW